METKINYEVIDQIDPPSLRDTDMPGERDAG